jgi:3-hydroxymyristoyl/3-hydroxydecanoyl-(acyl carrier protein) dehydratase
MPPAGHPWIARRYRADDAGVALCPSVQGIAALQRIGRLAWIQQLATACQLTAPAERWRLLDSAADTLDDAQIDALLQAPRPLLPTVRDETCAADGQLILQLRVPLELQHFDGHFASAPVLPGVLQVGWALALAAPRLGTPPTCVAIEALKFQQFLRPGDAAELTLQLHPASGKLHFAYRHAERAYSSGRLLLEHAHG